MPCSNHVHLPTTIPPNHLPLAPPPSSPPHTHTHTQVYVNKAKYDILQCCELPPSLANLLTTDPTMTNLHALPLFMVNHTKLKSLAKQYPQYDVVVGFQPTGWSFGPPRAGRGGRGGGGGGAQEEEGGRPATRSQRGKIILYQVRFCVFCVCVCEGCSGGWDLVFLQTMLCLSSPLTVMYLPLPPHPSPQTHTINRLPTPNTHPTMNCVNLCAGFNPETSYQA